jgi:hypothetical protein
MQPGRVNSAEYEIDLMEVYNEERDFKKDYIDRVKQLSREEVVGQLIIVVEAIGHRNMVQYGIPNAGPALKMFAADMRSSDEWELNVLIARLNDIDQAQAGAGSATLAGRSFKRRQEGDGTPPEGKR